MVEEEGGEAVGSLVGGESTPAVSVEDVNGVDIAVGAFGSQLGEREPEDLVARVRIARDYVGGSRSKLRKTSVGSGEKRRDERALELSKRGLGLGRRASGVGRWCVWAMR